MRFSTISGDILDDSVSTPRGLAIKVIGVEGERLEGSEGDVTQDFLLINGPAFGAPDPKKFLAVVRLLARTTDRAQRFKKILSTVMRQVQKAVVAATGHPNTTVANLGGQPETHILGETYYSQAPLRFGDFIAKISVAPTSPELQALVQAPLNVNGIPNGLREAVLDFFGKNGGAWEVRAQLCTTLNRCRSRTLRPFGRKRSVPIGGSPVSASSRNWLGARRDRRRSTMACRSPPGTDLRHTVPSAESCAFERRSMKRRRNSGPKETAGSFRSRTKGCLSGTDRERCACCSRGHARRRMQGGQAPHTALLRAHDDMTCWRRPIARAAGGTGFVRCR